MNNLKPFHTLILAAALSIIAIALCAAHEWKLLAFIPAALFVSFVIYDAVNHFARYWRPWEPPDDPHAARRTAMSAGANYSALVFAWGAMTMFIVYFGTSVSWQHGWQYGLAMALLAAANMFYKNRLLAGDARLASAPALRLTARLAIILALAVLGGLIWLILSGKLGTTRGDWLANHIFLTGGFAIAAINFIITKTDATLDGRPPP